LFESDAPSIQTIRDAAQVAVFQLNRKVSSIVNPEDLRLNLFGWMNANPMGGHNAPHTHPGAHWSAVYYVSPPDFEEGSSGMIEFLDPRMELPLRPTAGELILFPSYLVHWVLPNQSDAERVTIAFNATFRRPK
jgi:hypothetical protein